MRPLIGHAVVTRLALGSLTAVRLPQVTLPNGKPLPVMLLANKCDLPDTRVDKEQLDAFCKEHGFIGWFETSAKTNHNVEEGVRGLVSNILSHPGACCAPNTVTRRGAARETGAGSSQVVDCRRLHGCERFKAPSTWRCRCDRSTACQRSRAAAAPRGPLQPVRCPVYRLPPSSASLARQRPPLQTRSRHSGSRPHRRRRRRARCR